MAQDKQLEEHVIHVEWEGERIVFPCSAEDCDHAIEQAENAYPKCTIINAEISK